MSKFVVFSSLRVGVFRGVKGFICVRNNDI